VEDDEIPYLFALRHVRRPGQDHECVRILTVLRGPRRRREAEEEYAEEPDSERPSHENHPRFGTRAFSEAVNSPQRKTASDRTTASGSPPAVHRPQWTEGGLADGHRRPGPRRPAIVSATRRLIPSCVTGVAHVI
jgi:hypothetical protein